MAIYLEACRCTLCVGCWNSECPCTVLVKTAVFILVNVDKKVCFRCMKSYTVGITVSVRPSSLGKVFMKPMDLATVSQSDCDLPKPGDALQHGEVAIAWILSGQQGGGMRRRCG